MSYSAGAGTTIAADEVTINATSVKAQRIKLIGGRDGVYTADIAATDVGSGDGALWVDDRQSWIRVAQTPTVSSGSAYAAKDAIGALLTFASVARASGLPAVLEAVQIVDKGQQMAACDLVLFDRSITAPTDNAAFDPTDAELANCIGVVEFVAGDYHDFNDNSLAQLDDIGLPFVLNGTSLYGALVARGTPTYTSTSDIIVTVTCRRV